LEGKERASKKILDAKVGFKSGGPEGKKIFGKKRNLQQEEYKDHWGRTARGLLIGWPKSRANGRMRKEKRLLCGGKTALVEKI